MSQIVLTHQERIEAIVRLGYTPKEAAFLCVAALHGGFFLRRQYCRFLGKGTGGTASALIEKVQLKKHAINMAGHRNARVHHLSARPLYAALGQEDNRNRRERSAIAIKNRLMGLDFVLEHPDYHYLVTTQEKVTFFQKAFGIELADLPTTTFRSPKSDATTKRFFAEKYPIFIAAQATLAPMVSFCFIDEGMVTGARFEGHLNQYSRLLARLPRFEIMYVACREEAFVTAQKVFQSVMNGRSQTDPKRLTVGEIGRLSEYFRLRKLYEAANLETFDRDTLIRFRNDREAFSLPIFQHLYKRWLAIGEHAFEESLGRVRPSIDPSCAAFSTYLLRHDYEIFGA